MKLTLALALCLAMTPIAQAQTVQRQAQVYRCGPEGRDLRDSPCPDRAAATGSGTVTYDEPSAADSRAARERHLAESRQAAALAAARRASDAEARHQRAQQIGLVPAAPAPPMSSPAAGAKPPRLARPHKPKPPAAQASRAGR